MVNNISGYMQKLLIVLILCTLSLNGLSQSSGLKRYYKKISEREFLSYDSVKLDIRSKYGDVYHAWQRTERGFMLDFYVFKKTTIDNRRLLFKMDELTQLKNDSTFMFCDPPLKATSDTLNWVNGIWFYKHTIATESQFSVDSLPAHLPVIDYSLVNMGIYQYIGDKLVKISDLQSLEAFDKLNVNGFFYLPNPGFFYRVARFDAIE